MSRIRFPRKAMSMILLCIYLALSWNTSQNSMFLDADEDLLSDANKKEKISPSSSEFQTDFNRFVINETFDSDVFTSPSSRWDRFTVSDVTCNSGVLRLNRPAMGSTEDRYANYNVTLLNGTQLGFSNAQLKITWTTSFPSSGSEARLMFSKDKKNWLNFNPSIVRTSTGTNTETIYVSLGSCMLNGNENSLFISFNATLNPSFTNPAYLSIENMQIGTFNSSISDNSTGDNLNPLPQSLGINATIRRYGTESGLALDSAYYRIYYSTVSPTAVFSSGDFLTTTDLMSSDYVTLTYKSPIFTTNTTFYYALRIANASNTGFYWSSVITVQIYDNIAPSISNFQQNGTDSTLEYDMDLKINGTATDTGGMGLKHIALYWGGVSVNDLVNDGSIMIPLSGNSQDFTFIVDRNNFTANVKFNYTIYLYDNGYNKFISSIYTITPTDKRGPIISSDPTNAESIPYQFIKNLTFTVTEPTDASGVKNSSVSCFYRNSSDFSGAIKITQLTQYGNTCSCSINYTAYGTIWVWLFATDNLNNPQYYNFSYNEVDELAPILYMLNSTSNSNLTLAYVKSDLKLTVYADDGQGSGIDKVELIIGFSSAPDWNANLYRYTLIAIGENKYRIVIPAANLSAGTMYYCFRAYDKMGKYTEISGTAIISSTPVDPNNLINDDDPNTQKPLDFNMILIISFIGVGAIVGILGVRSHRKKSAGRFIASKDKASSILDGNPLSKISDKISNLTINKKQIDDEWNKIEEPSSTNSLKIESVSGNELDPDAYKQALQKEFEARREKVQNESIERGDKSITKASGEAWNIEGNAPKEPIPSAKPPEALENKPLSNFTPISPIPLIPPNSKLDNDAEIFPRLSKEMVDLYHEVKEYEENGQESMAIKGYQTLLRLAEKRNDGILIQFFRKKLEEME